MSRLAPLAGAAGLVAVQSVTNGTVEGYEGPHPSSRHSKYSFGLAICDGFEAVQLLEQSSPICGPESAETALCQSSAFSLHRLMLSLIGSMRASSGSIPLMPSTVRVFHYPVVQTRIRSVQGHLFLQTRPSTLGLPKEAVKVRLSRLCSYSSTWPRGGPRM